jgi:replication factor C small subunit
MWTEKYRPKLLEDIVGHDEIIRRLKGFTKEKTLPNLLLWGPKGSGKTSLVYALAQELFGDYENLMHIECSDFIDQRKKWLKEDKRFKFFYDDQKSAITIFKEMIKEYAALSPLNEPFKLLYLSNADVLPEYLQQALRRVMERSSKTCRFIFSTTKSTGVIPAIRSRSLNLRFAPLDKSDALDRLIKSIAEKEGITITECGLQTLKENARGDAGAAIIMLETAATTASSALIDEDEINVVVRNAFLQRQEAEALLESAFASRHNDVRARLEFLIKRERIEGKEILAEIHEALRKKMKTEIKGKRLLELFARLMVYEGEADLKLCYSLNTMIPLEELMMQVSMELEVNG